MQFLVVNRKRPEKLRYEVVPWAGKASDGSVAAVAHAVLPAPSSVSRSERKQGRVRISSEPHRFRRMFNWPAVPDFIVTLMTAAARIFSRHS